MLRSPREMITHTHTKKTVNNVDDDKHMILLSRPAGDLGAPLCLLFNPFISAFMFIYLSIYLSINITIYLYIYIDLY